MRLVPWTPAQGKSTFVGSPVSGVILDWRRRVGGGCVGDSGVGDALWYTLSSLILFRPRFGRRPGLTAVIPGRPSGRVGL